MLALSPSGEEAETLWPHNDRAGVAEAMIKARHALYSLDVHTHGHVPKIARTHVDHWHAASDERRERLRDPVHVREHGLCSSPATRTQRSPRMRVTLPPVLCHDAGQDATVTDAITRITPSRRLAPRGVTLAEMCGRAPAHWRPLHTRLSG